MKQVRHQMAPASEPGKLPGGFALDPSKHYVKVERESARMEGYLSPMDEMLEDGYALEKDAKRADLGSGRFALLSIDKAEFEKRQARIESEARETLKQVSGDLKQGEFERSEIGAPLTIKQLEASLAL